ncbi:PD-(D/E)XK nuclease family protein [Coxiella endosymbiont of Amblyomma nuttalli]|uniref:PD-(D/E)XK nuclease family protein n=1 Tax=Coxiella endosymbiont of Amblyomma nuttalli TaxID=2749996 RepID=UPI001BAABDF2|nr:PD-(D/E)XK nuclease family protein [Coxiella endosymbiont of Amblyomma nuttalli]QTS83909.1 ATP-dependent helicase/nuclease subunit B [Coxiella endosymbiont of Amblyomma nuttalli]
MKIVCSIQQIMPTLDQDTIVLTASSHLSYHLKQQYVQYEAKSNNKKKRSIPIIIPLNEWISQCWQHCQQTSEILLSDFQEYLLWREIIPFTKNTSNLIKEAWQLMKAWNLSLKDLEKEANGEVRHFIQWALQFETQLKKHHWISNAELPKRLESLTAHLKLPKQIILVGFYNLAPSIRQFLEVLANNAVLSASSSNKSGNSEVCVSYCVPLVTSTTKQSQSIYQIHLQDKENEIQTMARWVHAQWIINPAKKIGCIIPNLTYNRSQILRLFMEVFHSDKLFNISLGERLTNIPLIKTALDILELNYSCIDIIQLGVVFRSAYINSTDDDACLAAMLDVKLRQLRQWKISPRTFTYHLSQLNNYFQHSTLNMRCQQWFGIERSTTPKYPSTWAQQFTTELLALGWPGQRTLNTKEYQQHERWRLLLEEFTALDSTTTYPCTRKLALHLLRQLAHHIFFQPKTETTSIQILTLLEGAGENFDKVWMMGLNNKNWPPFPKPNPFLPLDIQKRHHMPHSSVKHEINNAMQLQQQLLHNTPTVILSTALQEGDFQLSPSSLIRQFPLITLEELQLPPLQTVDEKIFNATTTERIVDQTTPLHDNEFVRGGSGLLQSQSVCPFQAFAKIRLQAKPLEEPHLGLSNIERGDFLHRLLNLIWKKIKDWHTLHNYSNQELETLVDETINRVFKKKKYSRSIFIRIEKKRIKQLIKKWLIFEKKREPFMVAQRETTRHIKIGSLNLQVRIDRIDVIGNNQFLIDYKMSNKNSPNAWLGDRLKHIQLPLYCTFAALDVKGMAYAEMSSKKMQFTGLIDSQVKTCFRDITVSPKPWDILMKKWRILLHQLAIDFSSGKADVNPLDAETCKYCELSTLCRIGETDD